MWLAGAEHSFVPVTTSSLGRNVGRSQQSASKHFVDLEKYGFIQRIKSGRGISVRITPEGYSQLLKISGTLQASLATSPSKIELQGLLVSGMSEGPTTCCSRGTPGSS